MYVLGTFLLITGIALALLAAVSYILVIRGNQIALLYGRFATFASLGVIAMTWALLISLFLARRFDIEYVNSYSSLDLDIFFTVAASWAGQPGSFMVWLLWTAIAAVFLVGRARHFEPYTLVPLMLIQATLLAFVVILNPFQPLIDPSTGAVVVPADGKGLNPLLHNFWMIIHPPILFIGYALATIPFAFAVGALLRRDYDVWVHRALPWTLGAWSFLGLALLLGGYWAYETLGWGGYWGWDPVENSSLVPWILLTALLHGMLVQRTHNSMRRVNLALALSVYVSVFYATFMTRSGVYANFSVHSFVAEGIFEGLVAFMVVLVVASIGLFFWRFRDIPTRPLSEKFFSRDSFFVLSMLTLVTLALLIGIGTSMPVISAIPGVGHTLQGWMGQAFELDDGTLMNPQAQPFEDGRFSLAPSFYQQTTPPLGLVVIALMIIGPLLGWRDANMRHLLRSLRWPALAALIAAVIALMIDVRDLLSLGYVAGGTFAVGTNLLMIVRTLRGGWMRIGGYLAHVGFALMVIGVVGSSAYATPETQLSLAPGETARLFGFEFTFNGYVLGEDQRGRLNVTVNDGNGSYDVSPYLYYNERMGATMTIPIVHSYLWQDLYVAPAGFDPERNPARPVIGAGESATMGPYELTFVDFNIDREAMANGGPIKVGAIIDVLYEGQISRVEPVIQVVVDQASGEQQLDRVIVELPGGQMLSLIEVDPTNRMVLLEGSGEGIDNLPIVPAKGIIAVSVKPLVLLVWTGVTIGVIGGFIALTRRYLEGQAELTKTRVRLPKGFPLPFGRWRRRSSPQTAPGSAD